MFELNPQIRATEMYIRQGYVYIHNWVANAVLRAVTGDKKA